jgi:hypothetical protein
MLGANYNGSIFRHDQPNIIAKNPQQASIDGALVAYDSGGYVAGQTMAFNSTSLQWQKYASGGASGTNTALGFLLDNPPADNTTCSGTVPLRVIVGGEVWKTALTGYDANAKTNLSAREYPDFSGPTIVTF